MSKDFMNTRQVMLYYHTIKHLKWVQLKSRLFKSLPSFFSNSKPYIPNDYNLNLQPTIASYQSYNGEKKFTFLNQTYQFDQKIDWNHLALGRLWTYNLNYFEFLNQPSFSKQIGLDLIEDYIEQIANHNSSRSVNQVGLEPYPIALRIISWVKFIAKNEIEDDKINKSLWNQIQLLRSNLEYHLLGNHLLENAFGLLFGAVYFQDEKLFETAANILNKELKEQILDDGGHFELSPMYHLTMLSRVLDAINLLSNNSKSNYTSLLNMLKEKAAIMLGWLQQMQFGNGDLPSVNDSTDFIAPSAISVFEYAIRMGIQTKKLALKESGYRKYYVSNYEVLVDVGNIGPDYIPGHAHSDTFNFILHHKELPILVDTGISTYEKNEQRQKERSTVAHNTVMIEGKEQSEVWSGFRVARRAKIIDLNEVPGFIEATHNGYKRLGILHTRSFSISDKEVEIKDVINKEVQATAFFHFHPDCNIIITDNKIKGNFGYIEFENMQTLKEDTYQYAQGFNQLIDAQVVAVKFSQNLGTKINLA